MTTADDLRVLQRSLDVFAVRILARGPVTFDGKLWWITGKNGKPVAVDLTEGCGEHQAMLCRCVALVWLSRVIEEGLP